MPLYNPGVGATVETGEITDGSITEAKITAGTLTTTSISATAAIPGSKLDLTTGTGAITSTGNATITGQIRAIATNGGGINARLSGDTTDQIEALVSSSNLPSIQMGPGGSTALEGAVIARTGTNAYRYGFSGASIGFYGATPVARPTAYTQTYSTATRTHSTPTAAALSVSVGTPSTTIPDVGASFNQTTLNNIVRSLADQINAGRTDHLNVAQLLNSSIDDDQANGLKQ